MIARGTWRSIVLCIVLALAGVLGTALKPRNSVTDAPPVIDLKHIVPSAFAGWKADAVRSAAVAPDIQAEIDKLYSTVLDRTYANAHGQHVMLSIAYGRNQETGTQLHRPEFCYEAQGFQVGASRDGRLSTGFGTIPVRRIIATRGPRVESVTYWITVGNRVTLPGIGRRLAELSYGLSGKVPDGMLVRVSTLSEDVSPGEADGLQAQFVDALLTALAGSARNRLVGGAAL